MSEMLETTLPRGPGEAREPLARIGRFVVLDRLGEGGMGVVYTAYDPELDRKVAVKVLRSADPEAGARMQREARSMARLSDPNVVVVHEVGEHEGQIFIAMEMVRGRTLRQWTTETQRSWQEIVAVFMQAGGGLVAAHAADIVHRDFKPENVLVDATERAKVTDFGLARADESQVSSGATRVADRSAPASSVLVTEDGAVLGTPAYMAPEQIMGRGVDARADQFAFCVALWEALFGERPFEGHTMVDLAIAVTAGTVRDPPGGKLVPAWLRRVVTRGLAVERESRWPSMAALLTELKRGQRRARSRIAIVGVGVLVLAGLGVEAWRRMERAGQAARCEQAGAVVTAVWPGTERTAVEIQRAFETTGAGFASPAFERVAERLDAYATTWQRARTDACLAANVERDLPRETYEGTVACLDESYARLADLVHVLASADIALVSNAVLSTWELPPIEQCSDSRRFGRELLPEDPITRESVRAVRRKLAAVRNLEVLGRTDEALAQATLLDEEVQQTRWSPLIAEAAVQGAFILSKKGQHEVAEQRLVEAYLLAVASGAEYAEVTAAGRLAGEISGARGAHREAVVWGRIALATLERADESDGYLAGFVLNVLGTVHQRAGKPAEAIPNFQRSLEIRERVAGLDHPIVASTLQNICNAERDLANFEAAEAACRRAIAILESSYGREHPDIGDVRLNLGNVFLEQRAHAKARVEIELALATLERAWGRDSEKVALPLVSLAVVHERRGEEAATPGESRTEYTEAIALQQRALQIRETVLPADHPLLAESLINVAGGHLRLGAPEKALPLARRAVEIYLLKSPEHMNAGIALAGLGEILLNLRHSAEAVAALEQALEILQDAGAQPSLMADTEFKTAKALWEADQSRATALLGSARRRYAQNAGDHARELHTLEAWLASVRSTDPSAAR